MSAVLLCDGLQATSLKIARHYSEMLNILAENLDREARSNALADHTNSA